MNTGGYTLPVANADDARALWAKARKPAPPVQSDDARLVAGVHYVLLEVAGVCAKGERAFVHLPIAADLAVPVSAELRARGFWVGLSRPAGGNCTLHVGWFAITRWYERWLAYLTGWSAPTRFHS